MLDPQTTIAGPVSEPVIGCPNCGHPVKLQYCPACGQKRIKGRFRLGDLSIEFLQTLFDLEHGILFTTRQLLLRPGVAVREFLAGRRQPYVKPVQYYLLTLTIYFLVTELLNINPLEIGQQMNRDLGYQPETNSPNSQQVMKDFNALFGQNLKVIFSILLFISPWATRLVYRRQINYNFTELLIFKLYLYGVSYLVSVLTLPLFHSSLPFGISMFVYYLVAILVIVYDTWATYQFCGVKGAKGVFKAIFSYVLTMFFYLLVFGLAGGVFSILYYGPKAG